MTPGKLYSCTGYYLLIYPSKDKATTAEDGDVVEATAGNRPGRTVWRADFWSKRLNCTVRYSEPEEVFMCLEQKDKFAHVLFGEKQGWIINQDWLNIEKVK